MDCAWDLHTTYSIRNWKDSYVTELSTCLNLVTPLVLKIKSLKKPIGEVVKVDLIWYLVQFIKGSYLITIREDIKSHVNQASVLKLVGPFYLRIVRMYNHWRLIAMIFGAFDDRLYLVDDRQFSTISDFDDRDRRLSMTGNFDDWQFWRCSGQQLSMARWLLKSSVYNLIQGSTDFK